MATTWEDHANAFVGAPVTYPPNLWDAEERIRRLCGELDAVFPEGVAKATLQWPRISQLGRGDRHEKVKLAVEMAEPLPCWRPVEWWK